MEPESELELKASSPVGKLIAILIFAALWNGGISIPIFTEIIPSFESGDPEWGLTLFMSIFALVGLFLIGLVFYSILALTNPRPKVTINTNHLRLGNVVKLHFELSGNVHKISTLSFKLKGIESATYRRGTDTITRTETFYEIELAQYSDSVDMRSGSFEIQFPKNSMPTWEASNNKIEWRLELNGDIPRWPDIDESYDIVVYPASKL